MSLKYPQIKTIQIKILGDDYNKLKKKKGNKSWYAYLMEGLE